MPDTTPISLDILQGNLQAQINASKEMLDVIIELAKKAANAHDSSASPAIAPELQRLVNISTNLRESANGVAQEVVTKLQAQ